MKLVSASVFLVTLRNYRFLWLGGRYGGGKTSLAVYLSHFILSHGWAKAVVGNIPVAWGVPPNMYDLYTPEDCVLLLDEGGLFMKFSGDFEKVGAFMRKLNMYVLLPSVIPPAGIFRMFQVQRIVNFYTLGIPLWWYKWRLSIGAVTSDGSFGWWRPSEIFGYFDTLATPVSDLGVSSWVEEYTRQAGEEYANRVEMENALEGWRPILGELLEEMKDAPHPSSVEPTDEGAEKVVKEMEAAGMSDAEAERVTGVLENTAQAFMTAADTMERVGQKFEIALKKLKRWRR